MQNRVKTIFIHLLMLIYTRILVHALHFFQLMGFFNTLITNVTCPHCHQRFEGRIQFKFGATRQYEYHLNDILPWGWNEEGEPGIPSASVYGILGGERCPLCNAVFIDYKDDEYDILVEYDCIKAVRPMQSYEPYRNSGSDGGCYYINNESW